ncbi:DDB1-and CUL4-associated factor 4-like protein 1 [Trichonephila clavipes]|uniref:DDB1-and CUL4-associated factor 4-like protein 1 n=1 Tax=Trichonephila clavipes TaxID=2585209 RepID=A0A8X6WD59_TRICX|nr:DDB1-and CUL4-associated factor 4-like protein 1 [Trichonephila clavipes]
MAENGKGGILNKIALNQLGLLRNFLFQQNIIKLRINQLPTPGIHTISYELPTLDIHTSSRHDLIYWESYRSGPEGSVIGLQQVRDPRSQIGSFSSVHVFDFEYNITTTVSPNTPPPLINKLKVKSNLEGNMWVNDSSDMLHHWKKPLLIVGKYPDKRNSVVKLAFLNCEGSDNEKVIEWVTASCLSCCSSNTYSGRFAVGGNGCFYLGVNYRLSSKYRLPDNVLALEFNDDGNLLFVGSDERGIEICDTRDVLRNCNSAVEKEPALRDSSLIVNKMKLLSDQVTLIATDIEGEMRMVDLRMRRPVLTYSGHVGFKYPRPLCLDESLDLLCAAGKDHNIRIWSLSSGHLFSENRIYDQTLPSENSLETITHSCIITSTRRWFIAVIENQKVIPIVPAPGYLPKNN